MRIVLRMWVVRAGEEAYLYEDFKSNKIVSMGWSHIGDLTQAQNLAEIKRKVEQTYKGKKEGWKAISAGQLGRFVLEFKKGDYVLTYNPKERIYLLGKIEGSYTYDPKRKDHPHVRTVTWEREVPRDSLLVSTRNTLGAISTLFEVKGEALNDILGASESKGPGVEQVKEQEEEVKKEQVDKSKEFIKDEIQKLEWDDVQLLIAGILRAMGYKTRVSRVGSDRGKDVEASPDGLGLQEPHIIVEVKHRAGAMGSQELRSFIAALRPRHKGLYVSTGGFTKEAKYEADRANNQVTTVDLDDLYDLIVQYYDNFDSEARSILPLRKIYWPE